MYQFGGEFAVELAVVLGQQRLLCSGAFVKAFYCLEHEGVYHCFVVVPIQAPFLKVCVEFVGAYEVCFVDFAPERAVVGIGRCFYLAVVAVFFAFDNGSVKFAYQSLVYPFGSHLVAERCQLFVFRKLACKAVVGKSGVLVFGYVEPPGPAAPYFQRTHAAFVHLAYCEQKVAVHVVRLRQAEHQFLFGRLDVLFAVAIIGIHQLDNL